MANKADHRGFGNIRKRASGRYQVRYTGPDGGSYSAPATFGAKKDAEAWLAARQDDIAAGTWTPASGHSATPNMKALTFGEYAETWLQRATSRPRKPIKTRTAEHYRRIFDRLILPTFGDVPIKSITGDDVENWYDLLDRKTPTMNAHAYSLLSSVMKSAATGRRPILSGNPCDLENAATSESKHKVEPLTVTELGDLVAAMPERYRVLTLVSGWCGLRFGEATELRRSDIDLKNGVIKVRRGVVRTNEGFKVTTPKSAAGSRDVDIPPHLLDTIKDHLAGHVNGRDGLLFPAADGISHLAPSTLYKVFYPAREAIGRPDLRWHDLRHSAAVLAAATGATLAELMARLGHSTTGAAMRYQHAARGAGKRIAGQLSELATGAVK